PQGGRISNIQHGISNIQQGISNVQVEQPEDRRLRTSNKTQYPISNTEYPISDAIRFYDERLTAVAAVLSNKKRKIKDKSKKIKKGFLCAFVSSWLSFK
ncbi:MAG: hypothetical protein WCI51_21695, partial [Lentisphaerota bacterium]